MRINLLTH